MDDKDFISLGVFDLSPILKTSINVPELHINKDNIKHWSPASDENIDKLSKAGKHVKHLMVVGENDSPAFQKQCQQYSDLLRSIKIDVVSRTEKNEDHFSLVEKLKEEDYQLSKEMLYFMHSCK